jgi:two-component system, NtrC family, response regulator HupR/HoxA
VTARGSWRAVRLPVVVRWAAPEPGQLSGLCTDLSPGGLCLRFGAAGNPLPPRRGTALEVVLQLAGRVLRLFEVGAEVDWVDVRVDGERREWSMGVHFADPEGSEAAFLSGYLNECHQTVVVVDPDRAQAASYKALEQRHDLLVFDDPEQALEVLPSRDVRVLVVSADLPALSFGEFFEAARRRAPEAFCARLVVSEATMVGDAQSLIESGRLFAFLRKPFSAVQLQQVVERALASMELRAENLRLRAELERTNERLARENAHLRQRLVGFAGFERMVGSSPELHAAVAELARVGKTDTTVHLTGETGTGKELAARALHEGSRRAKGPFVAQNCAGLAEPLLQSILFGHRRGAFTGAHRDHPGVFEQAHGGTLFLDEVAELSPVVQAALLRAIQEGEVTPVGATRPLRVDVRLISATHRDLRALMQQKVFREDLFFRMVVVSVRLPPLRERRGDVPLLARHFLDLTCERHSKDVRGFTLKAMQCLEAHPWPGNVRELENEVERLVVLADPGQRVSPELLSPHLRGAAASATASAPPDGLLIPFSLGYDEAVERLSCDLVARALQEAGGVVTRAATLLGLERSRLTKMKARLFGES